MALTFLRRYLDSSTDLGWLVFEESCMIKIRQVQQDYTPWTVTQVDTELALKAAGEVFSIMRDVRNKK